MSGSFPAPTRKDHQQFCFIEQWEEVRNSRGKTSHHITYELTLHDGRILRTRISHPPGRKTYGVTLWKHILRDQLDVTESGFWDCVRDRILPDRGDSEPVGERLPAGIVAQLLAHGVPEDEIRGMTRAVAIDRMNRIWGEG